MEKVGGGNKIGFGIFCFGEEYYFKGTAEKIKKILDAGYPCYVLTNDIEFFDKRYNPKYVKVFEYKRNFKSYHDKLYLINEIIKNCDYAILIDADIHITDYKFLDILRDYKFGYGITYIDTLENHPSKKKYVKDLINVTQIEWSSFVNYASKLYTNFTELETIWEYFLVVNKIGFSKKFFDYYEKLQIAKEFCDLSVGKPINGAGEGISMAIAAKLTDTELKRDLELYDKLKDSMVSISRRHTPINLWPDWMK
jgi:hypothetical protein